MKRTVLLTPGPLTTSMDVKSAMLTDLGTRDTQYQTITQEIRQTLLQLAHADEQRYSCILLQGSGTYGVESVLSSTIRKNEKVLILSNGAYGERMEKICQKGGIPYRIQTYPMTSALPLLEIEAAIAAEDITHVAYIHCETTAGVLNDIKGIQRLINKYQKHSIIDAMSSFASMEIDLQELNADYLITSSNKCLHGVPGIAVVFAKKQHLNTCEGICRSLSLDLYEQYRFMEDQHGAFRFTSPTHVMLALKEALQELQQTGGICERNKRYCFIQNEIHTAMSNHGFQTLVKQQEQSPVITTYLYPEHFNFAHFYQYFKENGILLYNGKLPDIDAFRIGNIGDIQDEDLEKFKALLEHYEEIKHENKSIY